MTSSSHILILGSNSVHSLVPSSLIAQVESLLEGHKLEDAFTVADSRRKKLEESIEIDEYQAQELHYVYQRLGFQYFAETLFEDAGNNLFNGHIDPRVLVSYFPQLRGSLFSEKDHVDVFAGIADRMPKETSVEDLTETHINAIADLVPDAVVFNLVRNYSPYMSPNTQSAPPTAELRRILQERALQMLETFLKKERRRRMALNLDSEEPVNPTSSKGKGKERPRPIPAIIDTVLAKIYAQSEETAELYDLLSSPNSVILSEVESVFRATGQYNALCIMYQTGGEENDHKLLEVWSRLIDGEWTDPDMRDPLQQMLSLLAVKRDKSLTQKWGIWLLKRDQDAAIRLLTSLRDSTSGGKRRTTGGEDLALLQQIELANPSAAKQYLEYLVLQKRSQTKELHDQMAVSAIEDVLKHLQEDEAVAKLWLAKVSSYSFNSSKSYKVSKPPSFFSWFASTTPESPSKRSRLCCILFLAGSRFYNAETIKSRIVEHKQTKILSLELALLDGKVGNHRSALRTLACELNDAASAEAYCTLQGDFVPPKVAISIAEAAGLEHWEGLYLSSGSLTKPVQPNGKQKSATTPLIAQQPTDGAKKKELLKVLLEVYMSDRSTMSTARASQLLSAQAINLDVLDVLELVPPSWTLPSLSPFLTRSFRRITHAQREGQIAKNVSSGQNLETKEKTWGPLREAGALVEEELDDDEGEDGDEIDEKRGIAERVVTMLSGDDPTSHLNEKDTEGGLLLSNRVVNAGDDLR